MKKYYTMNKNKAFIFLQVIIISFLFISLTLFIQILLNSRFTLYKTDVKTQENFQDYDFLDEIIIAVTILLAVSFASLITFYSMNKSFLVMNSTYKREKEIITFRDLVTSHIKWNESAEIRVTSISKSNPINSLGNLFLKPSEKEGNLLVLKIKNYDEIEKKVEKYYRCFLFYEDKASLSYFDDSNIHSLVNIFNGTVILENCTGKFMIENNILKVYLKDKDKEYEEILYYKQK